MLRSRLTRLAAALVALPIALAPGAAAPSSSVSLQGWTRDGRTFAHEFVLKGRYGSGAQNYYRLLVVTDPDGATLHRYQLDKRLEEGTGTPEGESAWTGAEPAAVGQRWQEEHALVPEPDSLSLLPGETGAVPAPWENARLRLEAGSGGCPVARLVLEIAGRTRTFEDPCPAPGKVSRAFVHAVPSPDGSRLALGLTVVRAPAEPPPDDPEPQRGTFAIVSRRSFASIDLLDAGAGAAAEAMAERLKQAGFPIGHRGKAVSRRTSTAVYFAAGFEADARAVAELVGVAPASVQPLTWKSPFAITVAAGILGTP